jgi:uncharacterized protein (TIGR02594 family)
MSILLAVTASALRLRSKPELAEKNTLAILERGAIVEHSNAPGSKQGSWLLVSTGKRKGWVSHKYLAELDSPLAPVKCGSEEFAWMPLALRELGQREFSGAGANPRITEYQLSTELDGDLRPSDETPWCSDFACWCVEGAGFASTNSAAARSWLTWGRPIQKPRRGVVAVLSRGAKGGHVGFYISGSTDHVTLLGGNQNNRVSLGSYERSRVLGFRLP